MDPRVEPPNRGIGLSRGGLSTKIHQLVDGNGLPLVTVITPGQAGDSPMLLPMPEQLCVARSASWPRTSPDAVRGGKAYSSRAIRSQLRGRGINAMIPEPRDQQGHASGAAHAAEGRAPDWRGLGGSFRVESGLGRTSTALMLRVETKIAFEGNPMRCQEEVV